MAEGLQRTSLVAGAKDGASAYRTIDLGVTGLVVKSSPGNIYSIQGQNINAAIRYLKVYNKATAADENDTPVFTLVLPASSVLLNMQFPVGVYFSAGISIRCTTALADNSTAAPTANQTIVNITYK